MTSTATEYKVSDIRAWALASGLEVGTRGRLSADVVEAFNQAHGISA